jgi:hypothetical protein
MVISFLYSRLRKNQDAAPGLQYQPTSERHWRHRLLLAKTNTEYVLDDPQLTARSTENYLFTDEKDRDAAALSSHRQSMSFVCRKGCV